MNCRGCGRFLPLPWIENKIHWCSVRCFDYFLAKSGVQQLHMFRKRTRRRTPQEELKL